ncbi:MAG: metallophosphoesterase, partial [Lachnospiraceae bacterium]|nr:metallophosphoesterase [Lachnospiraceae bacterium]
MKNAVISDVHGNLPALEMVLKDAREQGADGYLFAGDYCLSGPYPDECIDAMRAIPGAFVLWGNEEAYLENLEGANPDTWTDGQMQISYYCFRNVRKENR